MAALSSRTTSASFAERPHLAGSSGRGAEVNHQPTLRVEEGSSRKDAAVALTCAKCAARSSPFPHSSQGWWTAYLEWISLMRSSTASFSARKSSRESAPKKNCILILPECISFLHRIEQSPRPLHLTESLIASAVQKPDVPRPVARDAGADIHELDATDKDSRISLSPPLRTMNPMKPGLPGSVVNHPGDAVQTVLFIFQPVPM